MSHAELHRIVVGRAAMGCQFEVIFNAGEVPEATELAIAALDIVDEIEGSISIYRSDTELARINATVAGCRTSLPTHEAAVADDGKPRLFHPSAEGKKAMDGFFHGQSGEWVNVSRDTLALLQLARAMNAQTEGGFDIAAGPLVDAWGFLKRQGRTPEPEELAAALAASGSHHLEIDSVGCQVRLRTPGASLNPGAIGKGWAIDRAMAFLVGSGVPSVLIHGGQSSVRAIGAQGASLADATGWKIGLRHPLRPGRRLATITLRNKALGTSGSGTQFFVDRGKRLGHILDPRTGRPAEGVLSATVIAESGAEADALATALYVLGPDGLRRIAPPNGATGAILVMPAGGSDLRVILANLDDATVAIDSEPGLIVERLLPATK